MSEPDYINIRQILGHLVGQRIVDVTQHDESEFTEDGKSYVMFMFDSGDTVKFFVGEDGFSYSEPDSDPHI